MISNDGGTVACGSPYGNYDRKWETMTGKRMCEPMKWIEGEHMLDEMKRVRPYGDQECDAVVREDALPIEMFCSVV